MSISNDGSSNPQKPETRLVTAGRETVVELTQSRIPDDSDHGIYVDCSYGWAFYLGNLKSVLEGGIDLRNKNVDIKNVVNS